MDETNGAEYEKKGTQLLVTALELYAMLNTDQPGFAVVHTQQLLNVLNDEKRHLGDFVEELRKNGHRIRSVDGDYWHEMWLSEEFMMGYASEATEDELRQTLRALLELQGPVQGEKRIERYNNFKIQFGIERAYELEHENLL